MIKVAAQKPAERKDYIQRCLTQYAALSQDPTVAAWQMKVEDKMIEVPAMPANYLVSVLHDAGQTLCPLCLTCGLVAHLTLHAGLYG